MKLKNLKKSLDSPETIQAIRHYTLVAMIFVIGLKLAV